MKENTVQVNFRCPDSLKMELQEFSDYLRKDLSELIREALEAYLESDTVFMKIREEREAKEDFYRAIVEDAAMGNSIIGPGSELLGHAGKKYK